ncbi:MAG: hypothetical protein COV30_01245 [Candidatus Yanofskybacteria bacterium CG10_big_fil_rev_8_21_14_0_10_37_15]|uniref:Glycosyl transferase family 1 domain-containing protein n=1 Tax=Candidatus Yanofskybacteria bacterium CG10_big_fil_rev_8_21_14_0_10_37_15 TaxID=1975097 RepID=A0A2H0R5K4_9BACT|nr:MAG: hypothetical protein COV30_01245 [Candidatus Yanofskybacteria bacterium CG10_big_fil_rev_8_21_14_0_10_37_15]
MRILIAGFPYVRKNYSDTFDFYPQKDRIFFLLPKKWKAKKGKIVFSPPKKNNVFTVNAFFYHSEYPLIGGLLKGWMPSFPLFLFRFKRKIDAVYSPSEPILLTTLYQGFWTKTFGLKHFIFTWENIPYERKFNGINKLIKKIILKLNLFFCDGVVCGNKKAKEILEKETGKRLSIIPMSGVDVEFFNPHLENIDKTKFDYLNNRLVFTFAGAIGRRKGIHLIIQALKDIIKEISNAHFILVGSGEYEREISDLLDKLNLGDYVTKIPWADREELRRILSVSDIFLYPSLPFGGWEEQFGYSMAEASLMELPVISTFSGSIEEVVLHNKTGILVSPDNVEELKGAMFILARDEDFRKRLGLAGRKYVNENFSHEVVAKRFYDFFEKI